MQFAQPQQQQTTTDSLVGDIVGKLMSKIANDGNKQTQEYSKEMQPINNNNYVNVYKDGTIEKKNQMQHHKRQIIQEKMHLVLFLMV